MNAEDRKYLQGEMDMYFSGEEYAKAEGYVPPADDCHDLDDGEPELHFTEDFDVHRVDRRGGRRRRRAAAGSRPALAWPRWGRLQRSCGVIHVMDIGRQPCEANGRTGIRG